MDISESTNRFCRNRLNRLGSKLVYQLQIECLEKLYVKKTLFIQAEIKRRFNYSPDYFIANFHITAKKKKKVLPDVLILLRNYLTPLLPKHSTGAALDSVKWP